MTQEYLGFYIDVRGILLVQMWEAYYLYYPRDTPAVEYPIKNANRENIQATDAICVRLIKRRRQNTTSHFYTSLSNWWITSWLSKNT